MPIDILSSNSYAVVQKYLIVMWQRKDSVLKNTKSNKNKQVSAPREVAEGLEVCCFCSIQVCVSMMPRRKAICRDLREAIVAGPTIWGGLGGHCQTIIASVHPSKFTPRSEKQNNKINKVSSQLLQAWVSMLNVNIACLEALSGKLLLLGLQSCTLRTITFRVARPKWRRLVITHSNTFAENHLPASFQHKQVKPTVTAVVGMMICACFAACISI